MMKTDGVKQYLTLTH